jgi:NitT/TauT family transport system substrate-binding protein
MLAGELNYSYMDGRNSVTAALKGTDVVIVAGVANRLVFSFMARPEIKSFAEMKGRKIGITRLGSSTHSVTLWVMNKAGIKPEEYQMLQLVDVPNIMTAIVAGQVDAGALSPPTKVGLSELMDVTKDGPEYVSVAIGSTRSFIKANEEMTRRFIRGYSEGVQLLKANKAAGIRAIQKYARIKDPEILEATYGEARTYIETVPYVTRKGMETILSELLPTQGQDRQAGRFSRHPVRRPAGERWILQERGGQVTKDWKDLSLRSR